MGKLGRRELFPAIHNGPVGKMACRMARRRGDGLGLDYFANILLLRSPRDSRYDTRSRTSSSLNGSSNPTGIMDTFDFSIDSTLLALTFTKPLGSSMLVITIILFSE